MSRSREPRQVEAELTHDEIGNRRRAKWRPQLDQLIRQMVIVTAVLVLANLWARCRYEEAEQHEGETASAQHRTLVASSFAARLR